MDALMRVLVLCVVGLAGCTNASIPLGAVCETAKGCPPGQLCLSNRCSKPECISNQECASGVCSGDYQCTATAASGTAIKVTAVRGSGAPDNHVRDTLVVEGSGLEGVSKVELGGSTLGTSYELKTEVDRSAPSTSLTLFLPDAITELVSSAFVATPFTLRFSSPAQGSVTHELSLLRGEKGAEGAGGVGLPASACTLGQVATWSGSMWVCATGGNGLIAGTGLALTGTADAPALGLKGLAVACSFGNTLQWTAEGGVRCVPGLVNASVPGGLAFNVASGEVLLSLRTCAPGLTLRRNTVESWVCSHLVDQMVGYPVSAFRGLNAITDGISYVSVIDPTNALTAPLHLPAGSAVRGISCQVEIGDLTTATLTLQSTSTVGSSAVCSSAAINGPTTTTTTIAFSNCNDGEISAENYYYIKLAITGASVSLKNGCTVTYRGN